MMKSIKKLVAALGLVAVGATSQAATVNLTGLSSYQLFGGFSQDITTQNTPGPTFGYYELVVGAFDLLATFTLKDTNPDAVDVRYKLFLDTNNEVGAATFDDAAPLEYPTSRRGDFITDIAGQDFAPFFQALLDSKQHYVLMVNKNVEGWNSITTNVSAVPLPGAALLFGTALAGFFGFSNRRKV